MQLHIFLRVNFKLIFCCQWKIFNFSCNRHECVVNVDITGNDDRFEPHACVVKLALNAKARILYNGLMTT